MFVLVSLEVFISLCFFVISAASAAQSVVSFHLCSSTDEDDQSLGGFVSATVSLLSWVWGN